MFEAACEDYFSISSGSAGSYLQSDGIYEEKVKNSMVCYTTLFLQLNVLKWILFCLIIFSI